MDTQRGKVCAHMPVDDDGVCDLVEKHVLHLIEAGEVGSEAVAAAFRRVHRHLFVEDLYVRIDGGFRRTRHDPERPDSNLLRRIYSGAALVTCVKDGRATSSSSESALVARMLELVSPRPGHRVLEIGTGSGYNAALLAELVGDADLITSIETQPQVVAAARRGLGRAGHSAVRVVEGDGYDGFGPGAPYDRIVVTVGTPDLSPNWIGQLSTDGRLVVPLRHGDANPLVSVHMRAGIPHGRFVGWSGFMAISGQLGDDRYYGPPVPQLAGPHQVVPSWPALGEPTSDKWSFHGAREGFWFYLCLVDARARIVSWRPPAFGLVNESTGESVRIVGDQVLHDRSSLLDELRAHYESWRSLGRPKIGDYEVTFHAPKLPTTSCHGTAVSTVHGSCYHRVYSLA